MHIGRINELFSNSTLRIIWSHAGVVVDLHYPGAEHEGTALVRLLNQHHQRWRFTGCFTQQKYCQLIQFTKRLYL
jgi:hypothetical protein